MEETVETNDSVFRSRVAPTPETFNTAGFPHSDTTPDGYESEGEVKPSERVMTNRLPLVADILGVGLAYKKLNIEEQSLEVDRFINTTIERQKIKDSKDSYEKVLEGTLKKLNLLEETNDFAKLDKLHQYAIAQNKLMEAIKENEELLAADPLDLPASKMRKVLEMKYGTSTS